MSAVLSETAPPRADWRAEYPFEPRYFSLGDYRMHYAHNGVDQTPGGPVVLCVHGNPTWSFYYRKLLTGLAPDVPAMAIDHLGCGLSDKPQKYDYSLRQHADNLIALIRHLKIGRIVLVVHDWGGAIGLLAATAMPDRIAGLMILNTAAFPPPYVPLRIAACRIPLLGSWAIRYGNAFARAATFMTINRLPKLSERARAGLLAPYDRAAHRVAIDRFVKDIPLTSRHRTYRVLTGLEENLGVLADKPTTFVWGMKDWCFRPECLRRLQRHFPQAETVELDDVGHYVMEEAPDEVLDQTRRLIGRIGRGGGGRGR